MLTVYLQAPAIFAPGLVSWQSSAPILRGEQLYRYANLPSHTPDILPPTERRRSSATTRLALQVAQQSVTAIPVADDGIVALFSSANGDTEILHQLCESLAEVEPMVSPMRFHNSVHNAPAGYWSIASHSMCASSSIANHDGSFAAGLLLAASQSVAETVPVLLVTYDLPFPSPLAACRPISGPFAMALQLTPKLTADSLISCTLNLNHNPGNETIMEQAALESMRLGNPAARSLPLLTAIANGIGTNITLGYLDGLSLDLKLVLC